MWRGLERRTGQHVLFDQPRTNSGTTRKLRTFNHRQYPSYQTGHQYYGLDHHILLWALVQSHIQAIVLTILIFLDVI